MAQKRTSQEILNELAGRDSELNQEEKFFREIEARQQVANEIAAAMSSPALPEELQSDTEFLNQFDRLKGIFVEVLSEKIQNQDDLEKLNSCIKSFSDLIKKYNLVYTTDRATTKPSEGLGPITKSKFLFAEPKQ